MQCVPPIFHNNKYLTDFKEITEIFNSFFANQCSLIPNNSILPSELKLLKEYTLTSCDFSETDIIQIINSRDLNNAHVHNVISIRMLKLCGEAICRPLSIIFKACLNAGKFSPNKSGFGESFINQLLSINHEILNAFDKRLKVRGIFQRYLIFQRPLTRYDMMV